MQKVFFLFIMVLFSLAMKAQDQQKIISSIFDEALTDRTAYNNLEYLCKNTRGRIDGAPVTLKAVEFTREGERKGEMQHKLLSRK